MSDIYFIECAGKINGRRCTWFAERDTDDMQLVSTVSDILTGQVEHVSKVWLADLEAGTFRDVTREVMQEVADALNEYPHGELLDVLENSLGCQHMAEMKREMA